MLWFRKSPVLMLLARIEGRLGNVERQLMTLFDDIEASFAAARTDAAGIATKLQTLIDQLNNASNGLTATQAQQIASEASDLKGQLDVLAAPPTA